jgi:8-oxo-dGTP pyrophosphatase MutT (NUDIX family)
MQKRKNKEEESKSPLSRHFSAGGAVYRNKKAEREWLLIKPTKTSRWQLPKGHIDKGEKSDATAVREVFEETGVKATIQKKVGTVRYYYVQNGERIFKTVVYFLMSSKGEEPKIEDEWKHEIEEVSWVVTEKALKTLTFKDEKKILEDSEALLVSN